MILISLALAAASTVPNPSAQEFQSASVRGGQFTMPYRWIAPESVVEGERYPLILFLHGAGERGSDNEIQLKHFPVTMMTPERRAKFPCFILAPQCPEDERWTADNWGSKSAEPLAYGMTEPMATAVAALTDFVAKHPVDMDRIYLTGLSMGGYGTFDLAARRPDWFAAVAPVCGGGHVETADRFVGVPLSIWHGDKDDAVPVERSRGMVEELGELGIEADYHELPGVGHDAWTQAYGKEGCLEWMFAQRRDPGRRARLAGEMMARSLAPDERVAFLGDSITEQGNESWGYVGILRDAMKRAQPGASVIPAGISGHKVPDLLLREEADVRAKNASLVFLYIGINDVWHSEWDQGTSEEDYENGLKELLGRLEGPGGATVAMATPSVIGEMPFGKGKFDSMLAKYSLLSRGVAGEGNRPVCDLQERFREHLELFNVEGEQKGVLTNDGVHLNDAGNRFVAAEAALAIRRAALARTAKKQPQGPK